MAEDLAALSKFRKGGIRTLLNKLEKRIPYRIAASGYYNMYYLRSEM
jgi:hypothetical protein